MALLCNLLRNAEEGAKGKQVGVFIFFRDPNLIVIFYSFTNIIQYACDSVVSPIKYFFDYLGIFFCWWIL